MPDDRSLVEGRFSLLQSMNHNQKRLVSVFVIAHFEITARNFKSKNL